MNAQSASYGPPSPCPLPLAGERESGWLPLPHETQGRETPDRSLFLAEGEGRGEGAPRIRAWSELGHVPGEDVGELVQELLGGELSHQRLLEERHAFRVDLAAPPGVGQVGADDRERERVEEALVGGVLRELGPLEQAL